MRQSELIESARSIWKTAGRWLNERRKSWTGREWLVNGLIALISLSVVYWDLMKPLIGVSQAVWDNCSVLVFLILTVLMGQNWGRVSENERSSFRTALTTWLKNWLVQVSICALAIIFVWVKVYRLSDSLFPDVRNVTFVLCGVILGQILWASSKRLKNQDLIAGMWLLFAMLAFLPIKFSQNPMLYTMIFLTSALHEQAKQDEVKPNQVNWMQSCLWLVLGVSFTTIGISMIGSGLEMVVLMVLVAAAFGFGCGLRGLKVDNDLLLVVLSLSQSTAALTWCNQIITDYETEHIIKWLPWIVMVMTAGSLIVALLVKSVRWTWTRDMIKPGIKRWWSVGLMAVFNYVMALLIQTDVSGFTITNLNYVLAHGNSQAVITALMMTSLMLVLWRAVHNYWAALAIGGTFDMIILLADKMKISARNEPILPSDLVAVGQTNSLIRMVDNKYWVMAGIGLVVLIISAILLTKFVKIDWQKQWKGHKFFKWVCVLSGLLVLGSSYFWNGAWGSRIITAFDDQTKFYDQLGGADHNGPIVQFLNNVHVKLDYEPSDYSKTQIERIERKYGLEAQVINKTRHHEIKDQNVIFNLSESLADPRRVPGIELKNDPMPYIHHLQKTRATGGLMMSSGYGGGTANMEWMMLTGMNMGDFAPTLSVAYTQMLPRMKQVDAVSQAFKYMIAVHPYQGGFYSRIANYQKMGIKHFYYQGNEKYPIVHQQVLQSSPYLDDQTAYNNALYRLKGHKDPMAINLITMQNHMPYNKDWYKQKNKRVKPLDDGGIVKDDNLWEYTTGVDNTDKAVKEFIREIDKIHRPITIVLYGDHLPGLYIADMTTPEDNIKFHETDYFIYSNKYARQHGDSSISDKEGKTKIVGTNNLLPMVYAQTDSKVGWYQALLTRVWQELPAMSANANETGGSEKTRNLYTSENGREVKHLNKHQRELLHDYRLIEYDMTVGNHYAKDVFTKNVR